MYNEKVKEQFVRQISNDSKRKLATYIFDAFEPYEMKWGADLCTRSADDLRAVLYEIRRGVRSKSRARNVNILKEYVSWCISNNIENVCDGMLHVNADDSAILLEKMISGPYHLNRFLDEVYPPVSEKTTGNLLRCYAWLAFIGVPESEAPLVRRDEVNLGALRLHHSKEDYMLIPESIDVFRFCKQEDLIHLTDAAHPKGGFAPRKGSTLLLSSTKVEQFTPQTLKHAFCRDNKNACDKRDGANPGKNQLQILPRLSYFRIWLSGVFYRTFEVERAGIAPDFSAYADRYVVEKKRKPDLSEEGKRARVVAVNSEMKHDYELWKDAFGGTK